MATSSSEFLAFVTGSGKADRNIGDGTCDAALVSQEILFTAAVTCGEQGVDKA
jgi:hypothetical protein